MAHHGQKTKGRVQGHSDPKIVRYNQQTRNWPRYAKDKIILGQLRQEVKVKVTPKIVHNTLHLLMHPHIDFGIPTFNSKEGMLQTHCEDLGTLNVQCDYPLGA